MKFEGAAIVFFALVLCGMPLQISGAGNSTISGFVRDGDGAPIIGAHVTATKNHETRSPLETETANGGQYEFSDLEVGTYSVSVSLGGYRSAGPLDVTIPALGDAARADFELIRVAAASSSPPEGALSPSPPKFEAAGVRGLIDPGGYSAPAGAAAATGVIKGMADIRRADANSSPTHAAKDWPCELQPELQKAVDAAPAKEGANLKLGQFYLAHGDAARAIPLLEIALRESDKHYATSKILALALLKNGQFESARSLLDALVNENPRDPDLHGLLARAQEGSGMFQQASEQYQAADRENPSEENLFGAGYELILGGSPQDSARLFQDGLKRYPNSIRILIGAGTAEFLRGNTSEGIRYFLRATDLAPSDPRAYAFLASAAGIQEAETEKVRASFKRFLDAAPNSADANYDYAMSLWSGRPQGAAPGETDNVAALLERAIQIKPDFALAHFQLGTLFFDRQDYAGAVREYQATLHLAPGMKEAHYRLARAYKYTGQTELATQEMRLFEQARNDATVNPGAHPISIDQFVSVIASTTDRETSKLSCPEVHTE